MTPREIARTLSRLIRGEVSSAQALRMARRAGFDSFAQLCGIRLGNGRKRVRLSRCHLLERIERHRRGALGVDELWRWADELYHVGVADGIRFVPREATLVSTALAVLSVICNRRLFPDAGKRKHQLEVLRRALIRGGGLRLDRVFARAFEDLPEAHLVDRYGERAEADAEPGEATPFGALSFELPRFEFEAAAQRADALLGDEEPERGAGRSWTDVVMIDRPQRGGADALADANWVIAFTVYTAKLYEHHELLRCLEGDGITSRRADRIPLLERRVPNFAFARYRPRYLQDSDGIAEIVLEAQRIGPEEVAYAAKLFALVNRIRNVWLDGKPLRTLLVHPGTGGRRRRRAG